MKYITKFTDHAAYTAAESSLVEPNVSYCVNENEVHYKSPTPTPVSRVPYFTSSEGYYWIVDDLGKLILNNNGNAAIRMNLNQSNLGPQIPSETLKNNLGTSDVIFEFGSGYETFEIGGVIYTVTNGVGVNPSIEILT